MAEETITYHKTSLGFQRSNETSGASDFYKCPNRWTNSNGSAGLCRCIPKCEICGYGEHDGVHGPYYGEPPGSKPYGHKYKPIVAPTEAEEKDE